MSLDVVVTMCRRRQLELTFPFKTETDLVRLSKPNQSSFHILAFRARITQIVLDPFSAEEVLESLRLGVEFDEGDQARYVSTEILVLDRPSHQPLSRISVIQSHSDVIFASQGTLLLAHEDVTEFVESKFVVLRNLKRFLLLLFVIGILILNIHVIFLCLLVPFLLPLNLLFLKRFLYLFHVIFLLDFHGDFLLFLRVWVRCHEICVAIIRNLDFLRVIHTRL